MDELNTVQWMTEAIAKATQSANFCVSGCLPDIDPGIDVKDYGHVNFPLKPKSAKQLAEHGKVAPYGKGTKTLVNKKVRNTCELDPKNFQLAGTWNEAIADAVAEVADALGLPADRLEAKLYKLLVYQRGGFFLPHRDSEKLNRMVASLIVVLPNPFEGGNLIVQHGGAKQVFSFEEAAAGRRPCYAAFYADCQHEVQRVTRGVRACLAYNLVLRGRKRSKTPSSASPSSAAEQLSGSMRNWIAAELSEPLVFALEHHYTERGLSLDLLKGADRRMSKLIAAAAQQAECCVHLAHVTRHLLQSADDGSYDWGRSRYRNTPSHELEIGETYEDDLMGTDWTDVQGKQQPWGKIRFVPNSIVSSTPLDDWKPTSEEYEGFTGNAGNTLDRWYHRSAIVVWHRDHHFDVVARSGTDASIKLFCSMVTKLAKTAKKRVEQARDDCVRFARAIVGNWPRSINRYSFTEDSRLELQCTFADHLLKLADQESICMFLSTLAERDEVLRIDSFVKTACREFGWRAIANELKTLITSPGTGPSRQEGIAPRDIQWLSAICCDKSEDPDKLALSHKLCELAVEHFCEPRSPSAHLGWANYYRRETPPSVKSLLPLVKALIAVEADAELSRLIKFVQSAPEEFSLEAAQVPCLTSVVPWTKKRLGAVGPYLENWLSDVRRELQAATLSEPEPPIDWARPAEVDCNCQFCGQLNEFLSNATDEVGRIAARENARRHLIGMIASHQCDVKHKLERKGSPYSLVLTKTRGSYDRALKRYKADQKLLASLPTT